MRGHARAAPLPHAVDRRELDRLGRSGEAVTAPSPARGHRSAAYPVTVSDAVLIGPAPCPGNAEPTPLNITSVTV